MFLDKSAALVAEFSGAAKPKIVIEPRHNIAPGQKIVVCDNTGVLSEMRWGMIPVGRVNARGRPVMETIVNVRSETIFDKTAFLGVSRCLVPASGWYEWTGRRRTKTAWRISMAGQALMAFAAICDFWTAPNSTRLGQVAAVTCPLSADVIDIHDRIGVILHPKDFTIWLNGSQKAAAKLMRPLDTGTLTVEPALGVDWSAA